MLRQLTLKFNAAAVAQLEEQGYTEENTKAMLSSALRPQHFQETQQVFNDLHVMKDKGGGWNVRIELSPAFAGTLNKDDTMRCQELSALITEKTKAPTGSITVSPARDCIH